MEISIETLRRLVDYSPETGAMVWREATPDMFTDGKKHSAVTRCAIWNAKYPGKPALTYREPGRPYAYGDILGQKCYAHRAAVALMTGEWPDVVDHIDGDKTNNAWSNLRSGSKSDNAKNCYLRADNASGHPGVYWDAARGKWAVEIFVDRKKVHLGRYDDLDQAAAVRQNAQSAHGYQVRHGAKPRP